MSSQSVPGLSAPPARPLELCGVGSDETRLAIVGTLLDGIWAALVAHRRSQRLARAARVARMTAMARLCPFVATVLDAARFALEAPEVPV